MAVILRIDYSKKLGLPNYSSHQCSVSLQVEINDPAQVQQESHRLYGLIQAAVDHDIQQVGFLPDATSYGMNHGHGHAYGNGKSAPVKPSPEAATHRHPDEDDEYPRNGQSAMADAPWACSDKQRELVLKLVSQHHLDKQEVEALAQELFGAPVKTLNRLQASGLIEELLARYGKGKKNGNGNGRSTSNYRRAGRE